MSVHLQRTIPYACVGTVMTNRKNLPQIVGKLKRGESKAMCTNDGIICYKWQDTKEVPIYYRKSIGSKQIFNFVGFIIEQLPQPHYRISKP